ncbi:MAG TPA: hypothetical protein VN841_29035 [Bryobacteraceae bacterium]|nr:hypothetical protein [Bryobacteraceae bacterium]
MITLPGAPPVAAGSSAVAACKVIPTLEVFDTLTGRTLVVLGHVESVPGVD